MSLARGSRAWHSDLLVETAGPTHLTAEVDPQPVSPGPSSAGSRFGPLRSRGFRLLFAGQAVSVFGDRLTMVAIPFAVLSVPGGDAGTVGIVLGANAFAVAAAILIGGVWGDRVPRRRTMLLSDVVRGVAQGVTAAALLAGFASVGLLVGLQLLYGVAEAFFRPAALGLLPELVDERDLQPANALLSLTSNVALVAGPAAAGALVAAVGAGGAIAVDAATFAVSGLTLALLSPRRSAACAEPTSFRSDLAGGWREVRSRGWVWSIILGFSAYHALVLPAVFVLGPVYAEQARGGAAAWGAITGAFGIGAVIGGLVALRWRPPRPGVVIAAALLFASSQAAIVTSPLPTAVVAGLEGVTGVMVALVFTVWETALQVHIPAAAQARVSSFDYLGSLTLMPLGLVVIGPLVPLVGTATLGVAATAASAAVAAAVMTNRSLRELTAGRAETEATLALGS
jgi:MFS family permease